MPAVLDEATAAVEAGLHADDGALLVVSRDETFLQAIGLSRRPVLPQVPVQENSASR